MNAVAYSSYPVLFPGLSASLGLYPRGSDLWKFPSDSEIQAKTEKAVSSFFYMDVGFLLKLAMSVCPQDSFENPFYALLPGVLDSLLGTWGAVLAPSAPSHACILSMLCAMPTSILTSS